MTKNELNNEMNRFKLTAKILVNGLIAMAITSCESYTSYSSDEPGYAALEALVKTDGQPSDIVGVWTDLKMVSRSKVLLSSDIDSGQVTTLLIEPGNKGTTRTSWVNRLVGKDENQPGRSDGSDPAPVTTATTWSYEGKGWWKIDNFRARRSGEKLLVVGADSSCRIFVNANDLAAVRADRLRARGVTTGIVSF